MRSILAKACEARGTNEAGIDYVRGGRLRICKRPLPAHNDLPPILGPVSLLGLAIKWVLLAAIAIMLIMGLKLPALE